MRECIQPNILEGCSPVLVYGMYQLRGSCDEKAPRVMDELCLNSNRFLMNGVDNVMRSLIETM